MLIGRGAAICAHPYATWRVRSRRAQVALLLAYATAGYFTVLAVLLMA